MRNFIKILSIVAAAILTLTSCLKGMGVDPEFDNDKGFEVGISATTIYANGKDSAKLIASFNDVPLTAEQLKIYDASTGEVIEWNNLTFSSLVAGEYSFYVEFTDTEGVKHTSDTFTITAVAEIDLDTLDEEGLTVRVTTNVIETGNGKAIFVIRYNGVVLTGEELAKVKVYSIDGNGENNPVTLPTDEQYGLLYFAQDHSATIVNFWFSYKTSSTFNDPIKVTVVDYPIPSQPIDSNPTSTSFNRRVMFSQFTNLDCGICPLLLCAFETLAHDEDYSKRFTFSAIHSSDEITSHDAGQMSNDYGIRDWPNVLINLNGSFGSYGYEQDLANIKGIIDGYLSVPTAAGIATRTTFDGKTLLVRAAVKAAVTNEYRIGAWVLENDVYGQQTNYYVTETAELGYNLNYHQDVVRAIKSVQSGRDYTGYDLGTITEGSIAEHLFDIEIDETWVANNCQVLIFVTAKQSNGRYEVVNSIVTPSLQEGVDFEYVK